MSVAVNVTGPARRLSAGVNTADWTRLADDLKILQGSDCWAHVDLMDGQFCPALTGGAPLVKAVAACGLPVDAHVMVEEPRRFLTEIFSASPKVVTVHAESTRHLHRTMQELSDLAAATTGSLRGIGLNPGTPVDVIGPIFELVDLVLLLTVNPGWSGQHPAVNAARRVAEVREFSRQFGVEPLIELDGGVTLANAATVANWGADVVVSGSAIFDGKNAAANLQHVLTELN